jgi:hypothetical protein
MRRSAEPLASAGVCVLLVLCGCEGLKEKLTARRPLPAESRPAPAAPVDPVLAGTIGAITYYAEIDPLPVRGFGIVIGLGENGSSDCPTVIRQYLIDLMTRERDSWGSAELRRRFSPAELIDSPSTAVVEVVGVIPAGAVAHESFDLAVRAIPGTSTRSLAGGLLLPCELRMYDVELTEEQLLARRVVARGGGPVFVNPFAGDSPGSGGYDPRRGYIFSGGTALYTRKIRLVLREPSYPMARRLETRINERFNQRPPVAEAISRGYLELEMPRAFQGRPEEFLRLLPHLYVENHAAFVEARLRELSRLAALKNADLDAISLIWEGVGRTALSQIQALYTDPDPLVRFYAARAGLRLQDATALPVVAQAAASDDHSLALLAVRELGACRYPQVVSRLIPLLSVSDPELRIAAYEALLGQPQSVIRSTKYPLALDPMQLNLVCDVVDASGPPLIYVRRTRVARIAVFGARMPVALPVFYAAPDDSVIINGTEESGVLTVFGMRAGRLTPTLQVAPRVADLIAALADLPRPDETGQIRGLGLPYSQVVHVVATLCRDGAIAAHFEPERVPLTELFGPELWRYRPETDESAPQAPSGPVPSSAASDAAP